MTNFLYLMNKLLQDHVIQLVADKFVFYACINARIVVDLNDYHAIFQLFEVNTIETLADHTCRFDCSIDYRFGHFISWHSDKTTRRIRVIAVVVNLPMIPSHKIFARIQRFAIEYADTPVKICKYKLLCEQQSRML